MAPSLLGQTLVATSRFRLFVASDPPLVCVLRGNQIGTPTCESLRSETAAWLGTWGL